MAYKVPFVNYALQYRNLEKEIDAAIKDVLSRGDLILRSDVEEFEKKLAEFLGVKYVVGVNSGTDALFFSLKAADIGPGDEVITVSHTFFATVEAIYHCGAKPVLIDVAEDFTMDVKEIEKAITSKTKAIMPVHLNGRVCNMNEIMFLAQKYNLAVIEDAAQALGAKYNDKMAGSFGTAGCFSFYPAKTLGALGDAGAVATNDENIAEKVKLFRNHGQKTKTEIVCYGWTSRLDNFQAAVLNVKINHLKEWIKRRIEIAGIYNEKLAGVSQVKTPYVEIADEKYFNSFQNYVLRAQKRDELAVFLKENGVEILIKDPVALHHHPAIGLSFNLPYTEQLAKEVISLPMYPELTNEQVEYAAECVKKFYTNE